MRILPVLDLLGGVVVRGVAGRRAEYRPVVSRLVSVAEPTAVAEALRDNFGLSELYVADLDAIADAAPSLPVYRALLRRGFRLWVDAGVRDRERADMLASEGLGVVAGLETLAGPAALADVHAAHADRAVFSLDLRGGVPTGDRSAWDAADAWAIACRAVALGARRLLVLDLARVGVSSGTGTDTLCSRLVSSFDRLEVWAGGGVRNVDDLYCLQSAGVTAVLVASALHDGDVTPRELLALRRG
jgi:phosphoribosylformimino-5-aminoimidazole carboxamide ribotide isomerase